MKNDFRPWSKEELRAYLFLYCANANLKIEEDEINFIQARMKAGNFEKIREEFDQDNDYKSIQKIQSALERFSYSKADVGQLMDEIRELFLSDGTYDNLERNLLMGLNRILT